VSRLGRAVSSAEPAPPKKEPNIAILNNHVEQTQTREPRFAEFTTRYDSPIPGLIVRLCHVRARTGKKTAVTRGHAGTAKAADLGTYRLTLRDTTFSAVGPCGQPEGE
jgi:hypothetical protein